MLSPPGLKGGGAFRPAQRRSPAASGAPASPRSSPDSQRAEGARLALLEWENMRDHVPFPGDGAGHEPFGAKRREIEFGVADGDDVGEDAAGRGRMLEAVAAEAVDQEA